MFLNLHAAIADSNLKLLTMGCEHLTSRNHPVQPVLNSRLRTSRLPGKLHYFALSSLTWLIILGIPQVGLSQSAQLTSELLKSRSIESQGLAADLSPVAQVDAPSVTTLEPSQSSLELRNEKPVVVLPGAIHTAIAAPLDHPMVVPTQPIGCWKTTQRCSFSLGSTQMDRQVMPPRPVKGPLEVSEEDTELGTLRVQEVPDEFETASAVDPELGVLRVQEAPLTPPPNDLPNDLDINPVPTVRPRRQPSVYLLGRVDYFKSSNVFATDRAFRDPEPDGLIRSGLTLFYAPAIGKKTFLVTSIDANLIRYANVGDANSTRQSANYDELRYRVGVYHRFNEQMSGEIGWSNQQLFQAKEGLQVVFGGSRIFNDHAIRLELSRQDSLSKKLALNSFYQFRWSFAEANDFDRDRLINTFITSLSYSWTPSFQTAIDYQYAWTHFTQVSRDDHYHQLVARLTYTMSPRTQVNVFSGFSFGGSSGGVNARGIDYNGFIFGAGFVFNVPLF